MDPALLQTVSSNFVRITVGGSFTETDGEGRFTMFLITVQSAFAKWEICRRYRHFQTLHQDLSSRMPTVKLPQLPGKKKSLFGSSLDPAIVEERKISLESYLRQLVLLPEVWASQIFIEFLDHAQAFLGTQMHMTKFSNRIAELESFLENMQLKYTASLRECQDAVAMVRQLSLRVSVLEQERAQGSNKIYPPIAGSDLTGPDNNIAAKEAFIVTGNSVNGDVRDHSNYRHSSGGPKGYYNSMYTQPELPVSPSATAILSSEGCARVASSTILTHTVSVDSPLTNDDSITATIEDNFRRLSSEYSSADRSVSVVSSNMFGPFTSENSSTEKNKPSTVTSSQYPKFDSINDGQQPFAVTEQQAYVHAHSGSFDISIDPIYEGAGTGSGLVSARTPNNFTNSIAVGGSRSLSLGFGSSATSSALKQADKSSSSVLKPFNPEDTFLMGTSPSSPGYFVKQILRLDPHFMTEGPSNPAFQFLYTDAPTPDFSSKVPSSMQSSYSSNLFRGAGAPPGESPLSSPRTTTENSDENISSTDSSGVRHDSTNNKSDWLNIARSLGLPQTSESPLMSIFAETAYSGQLAKKDPTASSEIGHPRHRLGTEEGSAWDHMVDELVMSLITPQERQLAYRASVLAFISKHIRSTLGVHVFEIDMQGLHAFLPDDPVRCSIFVGRADKESSWYVKLNERLCRLSGGMAVNTDHGHSVVSTGTVSSSYSGNNVAAADGRPLLTDNMMSDYVADMPEGSATRQRDTDPLAVCSPLALSVQHFLSNVSFLTNHDGTYKLQCLVDTSLGVEIVSNFRVDLCLCSFFEEVDRLVAKQHLFKRSLMLIRAWWVYEANLPASTSTHAHTNTQIPDNNALTVLVCALFHRHHMHLHYPFQALYAFFVEYSNIDFATHVFTIFGAVPYDVYAYDYDLAGSNIILPSVPPPTASVGLLTSDLVNKYRSLTQAKDCLLQGFVTDSSEELAAELGAITTNNVNGSIGSGSVNPAQANVPPSSGQASMSNNNDSATRVCFPLRPFMIAHPFLMSKTNMIPDANVPANHTPTHAHAPAHAQAAATAAATKRASRIVQSIQSGSLAVRNCLHAESDFYCKRNDETKEDIQILPSTLEGRAGFDYDGCIQGLFRTVIGRFGRGWRPDAVDNTISSPTAACTDSPTAAPLTSRSSVDGDSAFVDHGGEQQVCVDASHHVCAMSSHNLCISLDKLQDRIKYANLLLEAQVRSTFFSEASSVMICILSWGGIDKRVCPANFVHGDTG
jgi:hypothetical protein